MAGRKRVRHTIEVTFDNNLQKDAFWERLTKARQYLSARGLSADNNTVLNSLLDAVDLVLPSTLEDVAPSNTTSLWNSGYLYLTVYSMS